MASSFFEKVGNKIKNKTPSNISIGRPFVFFLIIIGLIFVMSVVFRISEITVIGNEHYTKEEILNAVDIEKGDNLFFFDRFAAVSRVFSKLPYVDEVSITRKLPGIVTITIVESKAMAYLVVGDEEWTIDHNCKVLGKVAEGENETLIKIIGFDPGTLLIGEHLTTQSGDEAPVTFLSEILSQIYDRELSDNIRIIDFTNYNSVRFDFSEKFTIILGDEYKTEYKFGMFLYAISQLLPGDVGTIDVSNAMTAVFVPQ